MKNNVLPFPSLKHAPKDPPRPSIVRGAISVAMLLGAMFLFGLTVYALVR